MREELGRLPTSDELQWRRTQEHDFIHFMWLIERKWGEGNFKDVKEVARSLMHLAEENQIHWEQWEKGK